MTRRRRPQNAGLVAAICCAAAITTAANNAAAQGLPSQTPQPVTTSAPQSMSGVIGEAVSDFRHIPSWTNLAIFAAAGLGAAIEHPRDGAVSRAMSGSRSLDSVFRSGQTVGGAPVQLGAALGTYAIGHFSGQRKVAMVGADLFQSQILAQSMTTAIKIGVGRTRPDGTQYSFPSGHSASAFATATVLQRDLGWKVGIPAYGLATYVAASRIQDKRHFLSDVTFGAAIGIVAGRSVTVGSGNAKFAVAPSAAPGGGGISFTWLGSKK